MHDFKNNIMLRTMSSRVMSNISTYFVGRCKIHPYLIVVQVFGPRPFDRARCKEQQTSKNKVSHDSQSRFYWLHQPLHSSEKQNRRLYSAISLDIWQCFTFHSKKRPVIHAEDLLNPNLSLIESNPTINYQTLQSHLISGHTSVQIRDNLPDQLPSPSRTQTES